MLKEKLDLLIAAMVITVGGVSTMYAQPWLPGVPGVIVNPNVPGTVGINVVIPPVPPGGGMAWDPLEISFPGVGLPPALRLSGTATPPGAGMPMDYAQLGYALGAFQFSFLATTKDLVLATQGISEDVIITANGENGGELRFATRDTVGAGSEIERMTITDTTGNVGIATTTPTEKLDVAGNVRFSGALMPGGLAGTSGYILKSNGAGSAPTWISPSAAGGAWIYGGNNPGTAQTLGTTTPVDLPFITNNLTRMTISAGGNVGIGTTSPTDRLHVSGTALVSDTLKLGGPMYTAGGTGTAGYVLKSNGASAPLWVDAGTQFVGTFWKVGGQNPGTSGPVDTLGITGSGHDLHIMAGIAGNYLRFDNAGNIGISTITPGALLDVAGSVRCVTLTVTSDVRWKQNVEPVQHALDKLLALRGVTYTFRTEDYPDMNLPTDQQLGLIAQEVEAVVPEVVETDQFGYKSIAYQNLVPLLIQGVKEQQVQIQSQSQQIEELRMQIVDLQARLASAGKGVAEDGPTVADAEQVELGQNVPNPFEEFTTIPYKIPASITNAELVLYEAGSGREVERFLLTQRGASEVKVGVAGLAAGAYVYGIIADGQRTGIKTMIVSR